MRLQIWGVFDLCNFALLRLLVCIASLWRVTLWFSNGIASEPGLIQILRKGSLNIKFLGGISHGRPGRYPGRRPGPKIFTPSLGAQEKVWFLRGRP